MMMLPLLLCFMSDLISDADGRGASAPTRQVFFFFGRRGRRKKREGENFEDGHVTRQQPSREAESRSSVKFSGSERLADD